MNCSVIRTTVVVLAIAMMNVGLWLNTPSAAARLQDPASQDNWPASAPSATPDTPSDHIQLPNAAEPADGLSATTQAASNGTTSRVSVSSTGVQGNYRSDSPSISADGRYVAFDSDASTLVAGDTNDKIGVFVHDRQTGQTTRVSDSSSGAELGNSSAYPSISADGRHVAFASYPVVGDTNDSQDIFVHDRQTGQTSRVSVSSSGVRGNGNSYYPSISADGRYVAFASYPVVGDTNDSQDIFVHDRQTGQPSKPTITSFTPASAIPGASITINGTGFGGATKVTFSKNKEATPTVLSSTQIRVSVPAGAVTGKVSVTTLSGTVTSSSNFTVTKPPKPTVTGFSPSSARPGATITINGTNFTSVTKVTFSKNKVAPPIVLSSTQIRVVVPAGAVTGRVSVTTPGGTGMSRDNFTVIVAPTSISFNPTSGAAGTKVTITGKNFVIGATEVKFGAITATNVTVDSATKITVYVPAGLAPGSKVKITVTNAAGRGISKGDFRVK